MLNSGITVHANFQTFFSSFLMVIRMVTGEAWNEMMGDVRRSRSIVFQCTDEIQDFSYIQEHGEVRGCGNPGMGLFYFVSFQITGAYIILNLFIAIILESYQKVELEEAMRINDDTI
jgi:hypothetical protein